MVERKVKKLPLVDAGGALLGLVTARDLLKQRRLPFATRDEQGRLRVGAAIGAHRRLSRARRGADQGRRRRAGHRHRARPLGGDGPRDRRGPQAVRRRRADRRQRRHRRGHAVPARARRRTAIKVGIGPGGGCTTRMTTSFGVPQAQALVDCRLAIARLGRAAHRRRRHQAARRARDGAAVRRRLRDARQRVRRHRGSARRGRPQVGRCCPSRRRP